MREALKVGVSGVRGVVGQSFTPQLAAGFAQAFGALVGRGAIVVGRDTRPTGPMIEHAIIAGLQSVGCRPVLAGVAPTPTLLLLTAHLQARGGIAITASHNPAPWNALKFIDATGIFLNAARAEELFDLYHQQDFPLVPEPEIPAVAVEPAPIREHFQRILAYVNAEAIRRRKFRVAVDCCNGVGALYAPAFLRDKLGCEVVPLFDQPTGVFERPPEPLPEHLGRLREAVVRERCDIGFAQDPDGDRLAVVSEAGVPLGEDLTLALAVQQVLDHHGASPVVVNVPASRAVDFVAHARNCEVIRTRIGEINVVEEMLARHAAVGGENIGGVIVPAIHPCRDSFGAMAILLELLADSGRTVSELRAAIPDYAIVRDKIVIRTELAPGAIRALRRQFEGQPVSLLDGLRVELGESWFHVRRSNTESVIRITAEAPARAAAEALAADIRARLVALLERQGAGAPDGGRRP